MLYQLYSTVDLKLNSPKLHRLTLPVLLPYTHEHKN